jgi:hypothetical protein
MASTAPTSTAATADTLVSATNDGSSGFLKISSELRNKIYGYAFETVSSSGPIPRALTQVNQQIRGESRSMYYASVECLVLPVRTLDQIRRTQKFLSEVDLSLYPVLSDIGFLSTAGKSDSEISIFFSRTETVLAQELHDQLTGLRNCDFTEEELPVEALMSTYVASLGFDPQEIIIDYDPPEHFKRAVEQGDTWTTRVFEYEATVKEASETDWKLDRFFLEHCDRSGGRRLGSRSFGIHRVVARGGTPLRVILNDGVSFVRLGLYRTVYSVSCHDEWLSCGRYDGSIR